jgi:hypothetical protein
MLSGPRVRPEVPVKSRLHVLARDRDGQLDCDRLVDDAVVVEAFGAGIGPIGDLGDVGADLPLGALHHLVDAVLYGPGPVAPDQIGEATLPDREDVAHGVEIAGIWSGSRTFARIMATRGSLGRPPSTSLTGGITIPSWWISCASGPSRRHVAADVHPMAGRRHQGEEFALHEVRRDELDVLQMASAQIRIVHDPNVAGLESALPVRGIDDALHGELHVCKENRQPIAALRDGLSGLAMKDPVRAVVRLRDDRRDGSVDEVEVHLVRNLLESAAYDGESHGIHHFTLTRRLPSRSTSSSIPGSTTVVVSLCSTTAGPKNRCPGARCSRA